MGRATRVAASRILAGAFSMWVGIGSVAMSQTHASDDLHVVEVIDDTLPFYDDHGARGSVRDPRENDTFPPMRVLLSRERYWQQDGHMDVVVQLQPPEGVDVGRSHLAVRLRDADGDELSRLRVDPVPSERFIFYPQLPEEWIGEGRVELAWMVEGQVVAESDEPFRVERFDEPAARTGRVRLAVSNPDGVIASGVPMTVGVPFGRGVLSSTSHLRLVDEHGTPVPVQIAETARWSKFGPLKWVRCDFTLDFNSAKRELYLEYGPEVRRSERESIVAESNARFPRIEAGQLRFDDGLWFDAQGDGQYVQVLDEEALNGAFVEHEDSRVYRTPIRDTYEVEESGPEKLVVRREGWYREEGGDREFCKYITRYVIHRNSPIVRVFHTWIFTGDGNHDRIRNMGWQLPLAGGFTPEGFLTAFGDEGEWKPGDFLLQHDYNHFDLSAEGVLVEHEGGRAPGVAAATGNGVRLYFGAKDFWQNYPSELEFRDGSLWFHNWPRHNRPARTRYDDPDDPELNLNVVQARFAHEGEVLDFRLPEPFGEDPIWQRMSAGRSGPTLDWPKGELEVVNAQGISRTEEFWLYLTPADSDEDQAVRVLEGLNEERLRAFPDPAWIAASGAFYEMHHQDRERFPEAERFFEQLALAPARWVERLGYYGMWVYGDIAAWGAISLDNRQPQLYRALRKGHHGWPYSWLPYARSGDPRLLKSAEAALRQLIDASYSHYASDEVDRTMGNRYRRRVGVANVGAVAWGGALNHMTRSMQNKYDAHWHAYYLTGFTRARDNALDWAHHVKIEESDVYNRRAIGAPSRNSMAMLRSFLETYEATFDPWFLVAAHAIAEKHLDQHERGRWNGHFYSTGDREFHRFTGGEAYRDYYLVHAELTGNHREPNSWARFGTPMVHVNAYAWTIAHDRYHLGRVAHFVDWMKAAMYDGDEPDYYRGYYAWGTDHGPVVFTSWALQYFPTALAALAQAEPLEDEHEDVEPIPNSFQMYTGANGPQIHFKKTSASALPLRLTATLRRVQGEASYEIVGPDGATVLAGTWDMSERKQLEIPADAPMGVYRLKFTDEQEVQLEVPVTDVGTPEVMVVEPGERIRTMRMENQVWFMVPEHVERFDVSVHVGGAVQRASVWGPDGRRMWNLNYHQDTYEGGNPAQATIEVEPGQADQLWRFTTSKLGATFSIDPQIPPIYATQRSRWFDPTDSRHGSLP